MKRYRTRRGPAAALGACAVGGVACFAATKLAEIYPIVQLRPTGALSNAGAALFCVLAVWWSYAAGRRDGADEGREEQERRAEEAEERVAQIRDVVAMKIDDLQREVRSVAESTRCLAVEPWGPSGTTHSTGAPREAREAIETVRTDEAIVAVVVGQAAPYGGRSRGTAPREDETEDVDPRLARLGAGDPGTATEGEVEQLAVKAAADIEKAAQTRVRASEVRKRRREAAKARRETGEIDAGGDGEKTDEKGDDGDEHGK